MRVDRSLKYKTSNSFFLFGARGTGKTHLLNRWFGGQQRVLSINMLKASEERRYGDSPDVLSEELGKAHYDWVVIDEVQKVPAILDVVHHEIETHGTRFALTGSSARKLKRGGANMLAGRAFVYYLFPLTHHELGDAFDLHDVLHFGALPKIFSLTGEEEKRLFLDAYVDTYLREEVLQEQLIRSLPPFRRFLDVCGQSSGTIVNESRIARDIGADPKTVKSYFDILEETLLGIRLPACTASIRKQQLLAPKFYLFDTGVKRALDGSLVKPRPSSQEYGVLFEHFIVNELWRLNHYHQQRFRMSHLRTKGGAEVDVVLERADLAMQLVEIKYSEHVDPTAISHLIQLKADFPDYRAICLSREPRRRDYAGVEIFPWREGIREVLCLAT